MFAVRETMRLRGARWLFFVGVGLTLGAGGAAGQTSSDNAVIDTIRARTDIDIGDQNRIADWMRTAVRTLNNAGRQDANAALREFRKKVLDQYEHRGNSDPFKTQWAVQLTDIATGEFARSGLDPILERSLARVLVDLNRADTMDGLMAGLFSKDQAARFLCLTGLAALKSSISADKDRLGRAVQALRQVGLAATNPVVLSAVYEALGFSRQIDAVFDVYLELFDQRLDRRRNATVFVDEAEIAAFEFFGDGAVVAALRADQKYKLGARLAVFLRMDAERYKTPNLGPAERDAVEKRLITAEECLALLVGGGSTGAVRKELKAGAHNNREAVVDATYKWIGHPRKQTPGVLNEDPWNVPIGAP